MTEPSFLTPFDDGKRKRRQSAFKVVSDDVDTEGLDLSSALADISAIHSETLQYSHLLSRGFTGPHSDLMDVVRSGINMYFSAISDKVRDDARARNSLQIHEKHNHTGSWIDPITVGFSKPLGHQCHRSIVAHHDEEDGEQTFWRRTDSGNGGDTWQQVSNDADIKFADSVHSEDGTSEIDSVRGNYQPASPTWASVSDTDVAHGGDLS
ncbi:hypothetical protein I203_105775 [Kwoniella mangroviensis CBS 8507]|uniref:uncharacterized protein n=1 Tax=Kwoniella mangroviensis CBS 8507 TaxID=1296122 RepID=UPI00080CC1B5|nr:uncharacterized protein I203_01587 [Kwoniella mangroviensis CBS 8507]OCF69723.1 hypothetical protein I203_01587 [Kwoniella mangroviensis CBS 8507]